jgi:hypothetical protein
LPATIVSQVRSFSTRAIFLSDAEANRHTINLSTMTAVRMNRILLFAALMLATSSSARAEVTSMKLVAPNVGWAVLGEQSSGKSLSWTTDGGAHWRDITPKLLASSESRESRSFGGGSSIRPRSLTFFFSTLTEGGYCSAAANPIRPSLTMNNRDNTVWPRPRTQEQPGQ